MKSGLVRSLRPFIRIWKSIKENTLNRSYSMMKIYVLLWPNSIIIQEGLARIDLPYGNKR